MMTALIKNTLPIYPVAEWDSYAHLFAAVTTSMQLGVYKEACLHLKGDVIDCGCGTAKMSPFLAPKQEIHSYTGVDFSKEMVSVARWTLEKLHRPEFVVKQRRIEEVVNTAFTSAVSIQSYYAWDQPLVTLQHIFDILSSGGLFVLATPNKHLRLDELAADAQQELLTHPYFEAYRDYNLKLATNPEANFVNMDTLIQQVRHVGFQVEECHQRHFRGGLNFLVLRKEV